MKTFFCLYSLMFLNVPFSKSDFPQKKIAALDPIFCLFPEIFIVISQYWHMSAMWFTVNIFTESCKCHEYHHPAPIIIPDEHEHHFHHPGRRYITIKQSKPTYEDDYLEGGRSFTSSVLSKFDLIKDVVKR